MKISASNTLIDIIRLPYEGRKGNIKHLMSLRDITRITYIKIKILLIFYKVMDEALDHQEFSLGDEIGAEFVHSIRFILIAASV